RAPLRVVTRSRVNSSPVRATVGRLHGATKIGSVSDVWILVGCPKSQWIPRPNRAETPADPGVVNVRRWLVRLLPNQLPMLSAIDRLCDTQPQRWLTAQLVQPFIAFAQVFVGGIRGFGLMETGGDCPHMPPASGQISLVPGCAEVIRDE